MRISTRTRLFATALCTLLTVGVLAVRVKSYTTVGHTWGTNQVVYYVNPQNLFVSDSAAISAIQTAAAAWHDQSGANIQLVYGGTTSGSSLTLNNKNEVFFRNDGIAYIGETYWWYDGTGRLVDADILLHETYTYFTGSGCSNGIYIEDVAIHEFGHALGLAHSDAPGATMEPAMPGYCDTSQLTLEDDDISGIRALYPPTASSSSGQVPATPSVLVASANPSAPTSSVALSWADNANNETGYAVERSTDGRSFTQIAQAGANTGAWTDTGLNSGTTYYYRVRAFNGSGNSAYSNVASAQTQAASTSAAPTIAVSSATLTVRGYKVKGSQLADLAWSGLSGGSVDIYRNGAVVSSTANDGAYTDNINKKGGGSYTYQACEAGTSTCTNSVSVSF
jgi:matrixin/fibronectin type III domain protein